MEWLQKIYICILNPFCGISQKINDTTRKRLIYTVVLLLYSTCYIWYSIIGMGHPLTLLSRMIESIFLIVILIFLGLEKPLKPVHWNPIIIGIWFALGILIFVMGFFTEQNTGYWMTGPVIALGLPCFFMVYGKREKYEMLFDAVCKAAVICSIAYFFVCLAGEFWNDNTWFSGRYNGLTIDANKIGELCLTSFCCIMYYLLVGTSKTWRVLNIIALGMVLGQTYLTQSRTTILAMIFIAGFFYIILIKNAFFAKNTKKLLRSTVTIILALLLALVCVKGVYALQGVHQEKLQEVLSSERLRSRYQQRMFLKMSTIMHRKMNIEKCSLRKGMMQMHFLLGEFTYGKLMRRDLISLAIQQMQRLLFHLKYIRERLIILPWKLHIVQDILLVEYI